MFVLSSNLINLVFAFTTYVMMKNFFYLNKAIGNMYVCVHDLIRKSLCSHDCKAEK